MSRYDLTTEAQHDLETIADYLVQEASVERAILILKEFEQAFLKLAEMAGMWHFREDLLNKNISSGQFTPMSSPTAGK